MLLLAYGWPREEPEETAVPEDDVDLTSLSSSELAALRRRLLAQQEEEQRLRVVDGGT